MAEKPRSAVMNQVGYLVILGGLVLGGLLGVRNVLSLATTEGAVERSHVRLSSIERLLSTLNDAETGQRGFLLVGDQRYLEPYAAAVSRVASERRNLAALVGDNPTQLERLQKLQPTIDLRLDQMAHTISLAQSSQLPASLSFVRSDSGKIAMDSIRRILDTMADTEYSMLAQRRLDAEENRRFALGSMIVSGIIGTLLIVIVATITTRRVEEMSNATRAIADQRERLRTTLVSIGDGVIATDTSGLVESMNGVAEALTGWSTADARGQPLHKVFRIVNEDTREPVDNPVDRALREGRIVGLANHTILISRDGSESFINDSAAPIRADDGTITGCVLVFRDIGDQREDERQLRLSDTRYRTALQAVNSLIWTNDPSGRMVGEQPWWGAFTGQTFEEYQGFGWAAAVHPDDAQPTIDRWNAAVASRSMFVFEHRVRRHDGAWRACTIRALPVIGSDGAIHEWVGVHTDVTDVRAAVVRERALKADASLADAKFRALFDQGAYFAGIMDPDGTVIELNPRSWQQSGFSRDDIVGKKFWDGPWWRGETDVQQHVHDASMEAARGNATQRELTYVTAGGSPRVLDMTVVPIRDEDGCVMFLAPTGTDITERVEAQRQLRETAMASQLLASIVASSADAIIATDPGGVITNWNRAATQIFGFTAVEIVGQPITRLMPPELGASENDAVRKILRGDSVSAYDTARLAKSGARVPLSVTMSPIFDARGVVIGVATIARDITDGKHAEEQLRRSEEELRRIASALSDADHRKDEFLATLAHELRNPLAPIRNGLQIMRIAGNDPTAMQQSQSMIERQTDHLVRLVDDLMDISRISRGTIALREELLDLNSVLRHAVETSRPLINEKKQLLTVETGINIIPVLGDRTRLTQIFSNLLNNASRYSDGGASIALSAVMSEGWADIRVRDTGIGIPRDKLLEVFEMFSQVDRSLERAQSGLGLGLTLVKRLVEMHGGRVEAKSDGLGMGSEFIVRIPLTDDTLEKPPRQSRAISTSPTRRKVLVVDDNIDAAQSLGSVLSLLGHDVRLAHDGLEALSAAEAFRPDIVLLDIGMPRLNGYEACRALRGRPWSTRTRFVALTGWGQPEDRQRSLDAGFDQHLVKPVDLTALHALMDERVE